MKRQAPAAGVAEDIVGKQSACVVICPLKIVFFCLIGPAAVPGEEQEPDQQEGTGPCEPVESVLSVSGTQENRSRAWVRG